MVDLKIMLYLWLRLISCATTRDRKSSTRGYIHASPGTTFLQLRFRLLHGQSAFGMLGIAIARSLWFAYLYCRFVFLVQQCIVYYCRLISSLSHIFHSLNGYNCASNFASFQRNVNDDFEQSLSLSMVVFSQGRRVIHFKAAAFLFVSSFLAFFIAMFTVRY